MKQSQPPRAGALLVPLGVFVLALAVRLLYLAQDAASPFFPFRLVDAADYHQMGLGFVAGEWPPREALFRPPLYPLLLGLLYRALGDDVVLLKTAQALVGALSCVLAFALAERALGSRRIALVAGLLTALSGTLVYYDGQPLSANLDVLLFLLSLLALQWAADRGGALRYALAGIAIGLAALNRGSALLLVPLGLGWIWLRHRVKTRVQAPAGDRLQAREGIALVLALGAVIAPLAWHNARFDLAPESIYTHAVLNAPPPGSDSVGATARRLLAGRFAALGWADGINLYVGNVDELQDLNREDHARHFERFAELLAEPWAHGARGGADHSRYFRRATADWVRAHPARWLRLMAHKALLLVNGTEVPRGGRLYADRRYSSLLASLLWRRDGLSFPSGLLIPLALVGLALGARDWRRHGLLAAGLAAQALFLLAFFVTARYRAPALPLCAIYAALAIDRAIAFCRNETRRWSRALPALLGAAALGVACNLPLVPVEERASSFEQFDLANALVSAGRYDDAIGHYREALAEQPDSASTHYNLGFALLRAGRLDDAIASYREAARLNPSSAKVHNNLGIALSQKAAAGDERAADEALSAYDAALRLDPNYEEARFNKGALLATRGRWAAAVEELRAAVRLAPEHQAARRALAVALERLAAEQRRAP